MIYQFWYVISYAFAEWLEWQDAKSWAKEYHPGWLYLARKSKHKEVRQIYRDKILNAYRGYDDVRFTE